MKTFAFCLTAVLLLAASPCTAQTNECRVGDFFVGMKRVDYDTLNVKLKLNNWEQPDRYTCESREKFMRNSDPGRTKADVNAEYDKYCSGPKNEFAFSRNELEILFERKFKSARDFAKFIEDTYKVRLQPIYSSGSKNNFFSGLKYDNPQTGCQIIIILDTFTLQMKKPTPKTVNLN